ncbi:MAG: ATP-binding protein [Ferruginibacter sp.]
MWWLPLVAAWCFTLSFIIDNYWSVNANVKSVQTAIINSIREHESVFDAQCSDTSFVARLHSNKLTKADLQQLSDPSAFFYLLSSDTANRQSVSFWSTRVVVPSEEIIHTTATAGFAKGENAYIVWKKKKLSDSTYACLILPVKWQFRHDPTFLKNTFVIDGISTELFDVQESVQTKYDISLADGKPLFSVVQKQQNTVFKNHPASFFFIILSLGLLCVFIHRLSVWLYDRWSPWAGVFGLLLMLSVIRVLLAETHFLLDVHQFSIFNSGYFQFGYLRESPGDILTTLLLLLWLVLFIYVRVHEKRILFLSRTRLMTWILFIGSIFMLLFLSYWFSAFIRSVAEHASVTFEISDFFSLSYTTVYAFMAIALSFIVYFFACKTILILIPFSKQLSPYILPPAILLAGLLVFTFFPATIGDGFLIYTLIWMFIFFLLLQTGLSAISIQEILNLKLFFWIAFFSISAGMLLLKENRKKKWTQFTEQSNTLIKLFDPNNESQVRQMYNTVPAPFLAEHWDEWKDTAIRTRLLDSSLSSVPQSYRNKYNSKYYFFDTLNQPLTKKDTIEYELLEQFYQSTQTNSWQDKIAQSYHPFAKFAVVNKYRLTDLENYRMGTVFQLLIPVFGNSDLVSESVFNMDPFFGMQAKKDVFDFAVYEDWKLSSQTGSFSFPLFADSFALKKQQQYLFSDSGADVMWNYIGKRVGLAVAKPDFVLMDTLTLFSYLFCGFFVSILILWSLGIVLRFRFNILSISFSSWSIRSRIKGSIAIVVLLSFLVIGISTILYLRASTKNEEKKSISQLIQVVKTEVQAGLINTVGGESALLNDKSMDNILQAISKSNKIDIHVFSIHGDLVNATNYLPFARGVLSRKMDPKAFFQLQKLNQKQFSQSETIGELSFVSYYAPILDADRNIIGFINIPYYTSENKLREQISGMIVFMIILLAITFILSGIFSFLISNNIVKTLRVIVKKMRSINLEEPNEQIRWSKHDEMGELVSEYNKMLKKLEDSTRQLVQNEREGAWREMAMQVAHEIKNPLTPMKLSLQFLSRAIEHQDPDLVEKTRNTTTMLIEQIDLLSQIAGAFSQFANISEAEPELVDLKEVLVNCIQLHQTQLSVPIRVDVSASPVWVLMDRGHLQRVFTNLLLNAIQAASPDRNLQIHIRQYVRDEVVLTEIADNGTGIDPMIQDTIFYPNFTTKSSGSGLGLAMCKRMIEQAGGTIHFETTPGEGTCFLIELPLHRS